MSSNDTAGVAAQLAAPFEADEVEWKPQTVRGSRALAIAYVDARAVMDRLDQVLGVGGWHTAYREIPDGVVCRLRARVGGGWVEHEDVGSFSDQPDGGDRLKAAFSDSLKRAAVHLGVGRYLYRLPHQWVDYDPGKKQFASPPRLPEWATPAFARSKELLRSYTGRCLAATTRAEVEALGKEIVATAGRMVPADVVALRQEFAKASARCPKADPPRLPANGKKPAKDPGAAARKDLQELARLTRGMDEAGALALLPEGVARYEDLTPEQAAVIIDRLCTAADAAGADG